MEVTTLGLNRSSSTKRHATSRVYLDVHRRQKSSQFQLITITATSQAVPIHHFHRELDRAKSTGIPNRSQNHHLPPKPTSSTHNLHLQHALHQPSHRPRCVRELHICRGCCRPARFPSRQPAPCRPRLPRPELRRVREQGHHHWRVRRVDLLRLRSLLAEWLGETMAQHGFHLGMGQGKVNRVRAESCDVLYPVVPNMSSQSRSLKPCHSAFHT